MEKEFSKEESLKLIETMVGISRQNLRDGGLYYILYGSLFFLASLAQYILYKVFDSELHWVSWMIAGGIAVLIGIFLGRRRRKVRNVSTYITRLNKYLWTAFIVAVIFVAFLGSQGFIAYDQINPLIVMIYGFATFIMGGMLKFKWLIIGGIFAWVIAVICSFQEYSVQMLLVSLTILVAYLIPGVILNYSKEIDV
jgi:hypothetical protein